MEPVEKFSTLVCMSYTFQTGYSAYEFFLYFEMTHIGNLTGLAT